MVMNEEFLTNSLEEFKTNLKTYLSTYLKPVDVTLALRNDYAECVFPLSCQQLAEDVTDEFVTCLHYHILYARKSSDGTEYHVVLYSRPYEHDMTVVIMDSIQHGLIESVIVLFFDSLDTMYRYVRQMWLDSLFQKSKLLEGIGQEAELMQDFL